MEFLCRFGWNMIDQVTQLIGKLCQINKLYSSTKKQKESSRVIYKFRFKSNKKEYNFGNDTIQ